MVSSRICRFEDEPVGKQGRLETAFQGHEWFAIRDYKYGNFFFTRRDRINFAFCSKPVRSLARWMISSG